MKIKVESSPNTVIKEEIDVDDKNSFSTDEAPSTSYSNYVLKTEVSLDGEDDGFLSFSTEECDTSNESAVYNTEILVSEEGDKNYTEETIHDGNKENPCAQKFHESGEKYQCDICNKFFTRKGNVSRHKLIHSGIKKHECEICNKAFTQRCDLLRHELIHKGIKNYECYTCKRAFTLKNHLKRHTIIHTRINTTEKSVTKPSPRRVIFQGTS